MAMGLQAMGHSGGALGGGWWVHSLALGLKTIGIGVWWVEETELSLCPSLNWVGSLERSLYLWLFLLLQM